MDAAPPAAAVELAPLDLFIGRVAVAGTVAVAPHHAVTATAHGDHLPRGLFTDSLESYGGAGGELGWHLYPGPRTLRGFWVGPSLVAMWLTDQKARLASRDFVAYGFAFDAGVTAGKDLVVDFGLGLQMTHLTGDVETPGIVSLVGGGGPRPRILFGLGVPIERGGPEAAGPPAEEPAPRWSVGFNPLAMAIGRYGLDVERLVADHLAVVVNAHGDYASRDWQAMQYDRVTPFWGFGGELGVRDFLGDKPLRGVFLGASIVGGRYVVDVRGSPLALAGVGAAADVGAQRELGGGFFLTLGAGVQYLWTTRYPNDIAPGTKWVVGDGADPRVLVTFGTLAP
jgi:hypothetical protein